MTTWVLLRGLAREARHWGGFGDRLAAAMGRGDTVLTPDLPGNGRRAREATPATIEAIAGALRLAVTALHPPPYRLVALSMGGMVAVQWAVRHPGELEGCALINSSLGRFSPPWQRLRPAALAGLAAALLPGQGALARESRVLRLASNTAFDPALAAAWARYAEEAPGTRGNVLRQLVAAARYRAPARAPDVPLLLLASSRDRMVDVRCSRALARAWRCPLREHLQAGHDLPLDAPDWLAAQLRDWQPARADCAVR